MCVGKSHNIIGCVIDPGAISSKRTSGVPRGAIESRTAAQSAERARGRKDTTSVCGTRKCGRGKHNTENRPRVFLWEFAPGAPAPKALSAATPGTVFRDNTREGKTNIGPSGI